MEALHITVLLVEDNPAVAETTQIVLADEGYTVLVAGSGEAAIELAAANTPDIIIMDWGLPGIQGPEALKQIRAFCPAPCIMLTARDAVESCVEALDAGCDDYVTKPASTDELLLRMRRLVPHPQQCCPQA